MKITIIFAAILLFASAAFAQGSVEGTITDAKGKPVANVSVTVVGANGKAVTTVKTDADGAYTFEDIAAGKYKIAAYGAKGFDSAFRENVVVEDDDVATVDLTLATAAANGGKTQTKDAWPAAKFAFEVQYDVGGKTYTFLVQEVAGLSTEDPGYKQQATVAPPPGVVKSGEVTFKKVIFKNDLFKDDKVFWDLYRRTVAGESVGPRGNITIRLLDDRGSTAMSWKLSNVFIKRIIGDATAIESMNVAHQGLTIKRN